MNPQLEIVMSSNRNCTGKIILGILLSWVFPLLALLCVNTFKADHTLQAAPLIYAATQPQEEEMKVVIFTNPGNPNFVAPPPMSKSLFDRHFPLLQDANPIRPEDRLALNLQSLGIPENAQIFAVPLSSNNLNIEFFQDIWHELHEYLAPNKFKWWLLEGRTFSPKDQVELFRILTYLGYEFTPSKEEREQGIRPIKMKTLLHPLIKFDINHGNVGDLLSIISKYPTDIIHLNFESDNYLRILNQIMQSNRSIKIWKIDCANLSATIIVQDEITEVKLYGINKQNASLIPQILSHVPNVTSVSMEGTLGIMGTEHMAQALSPLKALISLSLSISSISMSSPSENKISAEYIAKAISDKQLRSLSISGVGDDGVRFIATELAHMPGLEYVLIDGNFGKKGAESLARTFENMPNLISVFVRGNCNNDSVKLMAQALINKKNLKFVALRGEYRISEEQLQHYRLLFANTEQLESLTIQERIKGGLFDTHISGHKIPDETHHSIESRLQYRS